MWTTILSWGGRLLPFVQNIPYVKYIGIAISLIGVGYAGFQAYELKNEFETLKVQNELLTENSSAFRAELARQVSINNYNTALLEKERKQSMDTVRELEARYNKEISRLQRLREIRERTFNEEDGFTAPVLSNTIRRLFAEDTRAQD